MACLWLSWSSRGSGQAGKCRLPGRGPPKGKAVEHQGSPRHSPCRQGRDSSHALWKGNQRRPAFPAPSSASTGHDYSGRQRFSVRSGHRSEHCGGHCGGHGAQHQHERPWGVECTAFSCGSCSWCRGRACAGLCGASPAYPGSAGGRRSTAPRESLPGLLEQTAVILWRAAASADVSQFWGFGLGWSPETLGKLCFLTSSSLGRPPAHCGPDAQGQWSQHTGLCVGHSDLLSPALYEDPEITLRPPGLT